MRQVVIISLLAFTVVIPSVNAYGSNGSEGFVDDCIVTTIVQVASVINAGDVRLCLHYESIVHKIGQGGHVIAYVTAPTGLIGTTVSITIQVGTSLDGCTVASDTQVNGGNTGAVTAYRRFRYTLTSDYCTDYITVAVSAGATFSTPLALPINIRTDEPQIHLCDNTLGTNGCLIPRVLNADVLCDAPATAISAITTSTTCNNPELSVAITSWPTLNIGSLPTVNIAGSLTTTIASWPTLNTNTAVTSMPAMSMGITSFPNLNIASIPTLTVNDNVHILDSVTLHHILDSGSTLAVTGVDIGSTNITTNLGNTNLTLGNITFPMELMVKLCGQNFINGTCDSAFKVQAEATGPITAVGPFLILVALGLILMIVGGTFGNATFKFLAGLLFLFAAILAFTGGTEMGFTPKTGQGIGLVLLALALYTWANASGFEEKMKARRDAKKMEAET